MLIRQTIIVLLLVAVITLAGLPQATVRAEPKPIELRLGGAGTTPWAIRNIKPGDSGAIPVTLRNAGSLDGYVTIWIDTLISIQGPAKKPGRFSDHLLLDVSVDNLETNVSLPVLINSFPRLSSSPNYIRVNPLRQNETKTLVWRWELPYQTGNEIQGNGISFSINYMLEELPPEPEPEPEPETKPAPTPAPASTPPASSGAALASPAETLQVVVTETGINVAEISSAGVIIKPVSLVDRTESFALELNTGTSIAGSDNVRLGRIDLTATEEPDERFAVPENSVLLSPIYRLSGYTQNMDLTGIKFDPYAVITIRYNPEKLPENALPPYIVNYSEEYGLVKLEPPPGTEFEIDKAIGMAYHASYFAVMADIAPPAAPLPPSFTLSNLTINPVEAIARQPIFISVDIANDGETGGSYELYLVVDGVVRAIKEVNLEPRSVTTVKFEITNLAAGDHHVKIGSLSGEFRVISITVPPPEPGINWLLIDLSVAALLLAGAFVSFLLIRRSQKQDSK